MKVILNKDIPNLGEEGEIKDVSRGYARNFLIPNELVMPYSREAIAILESRKERLEQRREEKRTASLDIKSRLETEDLVLEMPAGDSGRLFGSVTSAAIVDALAARGISIERKRLDIPEKTIKSVGTTRVRVRLYGEEEAELKVVVRASGEAPPEEIAAEQSAVATEAAAEAEEVTSEDETAVAEAPTTTSDQEAEQETLSSDADIADSEVADTEPDKD